MSMQSQTGFSRYAANLTQSSTDVPVVTVLENDFPGTMVWTYSGVGVYILTASLPVFTAAKTRIRLTSAGGVVTAVITSTTVITITTKSDAGAAANALLTNSLFEVEVQK